MGLITIFDAMAETVKSAKRDGKLYYLYLRKSKWSQEQPGLLKRKSDDAKTCIRKTPRQSNDILR